ncbi:MAG: MFS transporter, partial [Gloeobacteraceae cyanobacterium ES-bin-316]|nr:MFS transporter [Ferruginibacter sp.]
YQTLFLLAFIPGVLAILFTLLINEKNKVVALPPTKRSVSFFAFISYYKNSTLSYKKLLAGLLGFALVNSSDVFLLLKMKETGISDTKVIGLYIFYNLVYALCAYPIGILADKWGFKKIFMLGLFIFSIVYAGFAIANTFWLYGILLLLYGVYAAATEGIAKAWISNISAKDETATAIGTYSGFQSIAALTASSVGGLIWYLFGSVFTFGLAAFVTLLAIVYLQFSNLKEQEHV